MQKLSGKLTFILLCVLTLAHAAITLLFALTRLYSYKASLLDIGLFDQLLWNMLHHGVPVTTATLPFTPQHWLGFHFSPLLAALLPFYAVWPYPETLQTAQSLCFAAAGIPLFYAARAAGAKQHEAWICSALFWCNPFVLSAAVWDFHEIAFSTLLIAIALWALCAKRFKAMLLALALLLLTKEHYGVSIAGFGFLWGWRYKAWKQGACVMAAGIAASYFIIAIIMPHFSGGTHAMMSGSGNVVSRYSWLFEPWPEKIAVFNAIFFGAGTSHMTGVLYLLLLLISGLFMPLAAPLYMAPAAADLLANLLSTNPMPRHLAAYHSAAVIPIVIIAALQGYRWFCARLRTSRPLLKAVAVIMMVVFPLTGLTAYPLKMWELMPPQLSYDKAVIQDIQKVLGDKAVVAQANIGMYFSGRSEIYPFPNKLDQAHFVVLHIANPFTDYENLRFRIPYGEDNGEYIRYTYDFLTAPNWRIAYWNKPWLVLERGKAAEDETVKRTEILQAIEDLAGIIARPGPQNP